MVRARATFDFPEQLEAFLIALAAVAGLEIVTGLFCVWSVHVRAALTCRKVGCTPRVYRIF